MSSRVMPSDTGAAGTPAGATAVGSGHRTPPPPEMSASDGGRRRATRAKWWWFPYAIVAPAVLMELLVHVIPLLTGVWMSFIKLNKFFIRRWTQAPVVGVDNYKLSLNFNTDLGKGLLHSFLITCAYTAVVVSISWALGMAAAVVLQRPFRTRGLWRTIFLIPYALPMYAGIITWNFMFQRDTGAVNHFLIDQLHLSGTRPFWLLGSNAFVSLCVVAIWKMWPFAFLMLMAGLQSIPGDVYEAASIDGASPWHQFRRITVPMLSSVNLVLLLVMFLWVFNDFNTPFVLFGTAQPPAGDLISFHIYNASFLSWNFGLGAAMSVLLLLFLLIVTGVYLIATNRRRDNA